MHRPDLPSSPTDSVKLARPVDTLRAGLTDSIPAAGHKVETNRRTTAVMIPSLSWSLGAGAPTFPLRDRFRSELANTALQDSLVVDQPWDGSQLGFSTGVEAAYQWDYLRPTIGAEWSFWDSRAVFHDPLKGDSSSTERSWRTDQLMGLVGLDALLPPKLLSVANAQAPYFGFRFAYGLGRIEGLGRAWAQGGGWQAHFGADFASIGPLVFSGRLGWSSLSLHSDSPMQRILYDGVGSDKVRWNGSGLWLNLVVRLRPTPIAADSVRSREPSHAPADSLPSPRMKG